eukprot:768197-Hanusia_phi.AAC.1
MSATDWIATIRCPARGTGSFVFRVLVLQSNEVNVRAACTSPARHHHTSIHLHPTKQGDFSPAVNDEGSLEGFEGHSCMAVASGGVSSYRVDKLPLKG